MKFIIIFSLIITILVLTKLYPKIMDYYEDKRIKYYYSIDHGKWVSGAGKKCRFFQSPDPSKDWYSRHCELEYDKNGKIYGVSTKKEGNDS